MYERLFFIENKLRRILLLFVFLAPNFLHETPLLKTKATVNSFNINVYSGARIFRLTITSINVIGLQLLATEKLALCYI